MRWTEMPSMVQIDLTGLFGLIGAIGTPKFDRLLLSSINNMGNFDDAIGLVVPFDGTPQPVGWCSHRADVAEQARTLASLFSREGEGSFLPTPESAEPDRWYMAVLRPSWFENEDERWTVYGQYDYRLGLLIARRTPGAWGITILRSADEIDQAMLVRIAQHVALVGLFAYRHIYGLGDESAFAPRPNSKKRLSIEVKERFPSLTAREQEVLVETLSGQTASATSKSLGISVPTVMTYRRRAYRRLGISHASEVLPELI